MRIAVSAIEYTTRFNETITHLFGLDENREFVHLQVTGINPFFYVPDNLHIPKNPKVQRLVEGWNDLKDNLVTRVVMCRPVDVGGKRGDPDNTGFREVFETTFEDDIEFKTRVAIEMGLKSGIEVREIKPNYVWGFDYIEPVEFKQELRRIHLDIEVSVKESRGRIPQWQNPVNAIYSVANFDTFDQRFNIFVWHQSFENRKREIVTYTVPFDVSQYGGMFRQDYELYIWKFDNEYDMLSMWVQYITQKRPNILSGYNSLRFDFPYLLARMQRLKISFQSISPIRQAYIHKSRGNVSIKGVILFDTWLGFKKTLLSERKSNRLDNVAKDLFGVGKVVHQGIDNMFDEEIDKLILYNVQDVFLEYAIGEFQRVFQFFYDIKCYAGCHFEDVFSNNRIVDAFLLFKAHERRLVLPSKRNRTAKTYKGAIVIQAPSEGLQHWVVIMDLKSLYPHCMISLNMGEDTVVINPDDEDIDELIKSPLKGVYFRKDKESFLVGILKELIHYRDELKLLVKEYKATGQKNKADVYNRIQTVVKFITNSIYGVLGWVNFRLYNRSIAASITAVARKVIEFTIKIMVAALWIIYYGDTDSIFALLKSRGRAAIEQEINDMYLLINGAYDKLKEVFNIDEHYFLMLPEKIYKTMLMSRKKDSDRAAKKRYAGLKVAEFDPVEQKWYWFDEPKLDIKGYDRSDMSTIGNKLMKRVLKMAVMEEPKEKIVRLIRETIWKIRHNKYPLEEVGFSKGINQNLSAYKSPGDWVRAAIWTNRWSSLWGNQTNYGSGSKPVFIYIKKNQVPAPYDDIELVALDENDYLPPHIQEIIDWDTVIEKTIRWKIETILEAIGINWDRELGKTKVKGILCH